MVRERKMEFETIIYEKRENVAWITLNRPEVLNAQNETLMAELTSALEQTNDDDGTYVMVITGAGDRTSSAGANIRMFPTCIPIKVVKKFKGVKRPYGFISEISKRS